MRRMNKRYVPGDRWVECDVCGYGYRFSQMKKGVSGRQKGFNVCPDCFDHKHPNDDWVLPVKPEGILKEVK